MQQDMALALGSKSRVVGLLGATRSIAAKESLIATLIGSKECQLEHANLGLSPDIDSGIVIFRKPASQTVYMYVDNGWMLNTRFLGRVQEILKKASTCTAGDGEGMVQSMQHWQSTHKWLHDSEFQLLRRLLVLFLRSDVVLVVDDSGGAHARFDLRYLRLFLALQRAKTTLRQKRILLDAGLLACQKQSPVLVFAFVHGPTKISASPSASRRLASSLEEQMRALLQGLHGHPSALFSLPESGMLAHCVARAYVHEGVFPARHAYADFDRLQAFLAAYPYKFDENERQSMPSIATVLRNCKGGSTSEVLEALEPMLCPPMLASYCAHQCALARENALDHYKSKVPAKYDANTHASAMVAAKQHFASQTGMCGPSVLDQLSQLTVECDALWGKERRLCGAVSMNGFPCTRLEHDEAEHCSGLTMRRSCACGRSQRTVADAFDLAKANASVVSCCASLRPFLPLTWQLRSSMDASHKLAGQDDTQRDITVEGWSLCRLSNASSYSEKTGMLFKGFVAGHQHLQRAAFFSANERLSFETALQNIQQTFRWQSTVKQNRPSTLLSPQTKTVVGFAGCEFACARAGHRFFRHHKQTERILAQQASWPPNDTPLRIPCPFCQQESKALLVRVYFVVPAGMHCLRAYVRPRVCLSFGTDEVAQVVHCRDALGPGLYCLKLPFVYGHFTEAAPGHAPKSPRIITPASMSSHCRLLRHAISFTSSSTLK